MAAHDPLKLPQWLYQLLPGARVNACRFRWDLSTFAAATATPLASAVSSASADSEWREGAAATRTAGMIASAGI